ncbi:SMAD/FHA domain-containing protein [Boletus reticuloceps]|uniref:SMAD/FHA domain-containing protein n=1 Tax=Boletus reticuloceps TaxID=495285 RepID=A0A8I2YEQ8_9AGAM|nr:SMAD/FHA domain-containing protein [Boletus reticuloceps]
MESVANAESPSALRSTILGSFLRARPSRGLSGTSPPAPTQQDSPPSPPASPVPPNARAHRRRSFAPASLIIPQLAANGNPQTTPVSASLGISHILRRRRSTGQPNSTAIPPTVQPATTPPSPPPLHSLTAESMPLAVPPQLHRGPSSTSSSPNQAHRIRLVPHLDSRRTLRFEPITRDLKDDDPPLRIGRFTDRSGIGLNASNLLSSNKLAFKSKVVSRSHAEIWLESGKFFIKDTKSSSGTFLNHLRLSPAGQESRPFQLRDGDVLQLGVDYQGGSEDIYKSVKIKIEVGREWQAGANAFNTHAISQLKALAVTTDPAPKELSKGKQRLPKTNIPDCCICLFSVSIRQALFIAPCSHAFHYKCIRPLLEKHNSAFSCPLCRSFADLDEDVEIDHEPEPEDDDIIEWEDVGAVAPSPQIFVPATSARRLASPPPLARDGAETEVETDMLGNEPRSRRQRPTVRTDGHIAIPPMVDLSEHVDLDTEMLDVDADDRDIYPRDGESQNHDRPGTGFVTRGPGFGLPLPGNSSGPHDDGSEGDGSRSASAEGGVIVAGFIPDAEPVISGKRKR